MNGLHFRWARCNKGSKTKPCLFCLFPSLPAYQPTSPQRTRLSAYHPIKYNSASQAAYPPLCFQRNHTRCLGKRPLARWNRGMGQILQQCEERDGQYKGVAMRSKSRHTTAARPCWAAQSSAVLQSSHGGPTPWGGAIALLGASGRDWA